jgi:NAD/NADP transhydrogenase alpha subunit
MKVGVPTEIKTDEYRVALTPAGVRELVEHGHEVLIQAGAGEGSAISDDEYTSQGARIVPDAAAVFAEAEMVVKVKEPQAVEGGDARAASHPLHLPAPGAGPGADARGWSTRARPASPTRPSRTRAGGCRCWRR